MFEWFKAPPAQPVTKSPEEVDKDYRYWRIHVMACIWVGYAAFYFTRNSYKSLIPAIRADLDFSLAELGILSTIFYIVYGSSRFLGGILSDKSNPRYFMGIGLVLTGVLNIVFGLSSTVTAFTLIWGLNAFFQGWGWPPCTKIMTTWYSRNERGFWWALCNTSHNLGGAIIPILTAFLAEAYNWRVGMMVPGVISIIIGLMLCVFLRDRPESMGLPKVGEWRKDELEMEQVKTSDSTLSTWTVLKKYVLTNKFIWLLAFSYVLVYVVRIGMNDWTNLYLREVRGVDLLIANSAITTFEIGGFLGTIAAGWGSDLLFKGNRIPMNILFMVGITVCIVFLWLIPVDPNADQFWLTIQLGTAYFFLGFFIFGPQMLTGMAAAEVCHKDYAGTATGFMGLFGYMGAAMTGLPLGYLIDKHGWSTFYEIMIAASILSAVLIVPIISGKSKKV